MSKDETATPSNKCAIDIDRSPAPPWTGLYFACENCGARYQLGAADPCIPLLDAPHKFVAPECWTCGLNNIVSVPFVPSVPSAVEDF